MSFLKHLLNPLAGATAPIDAAKIAVDPRNAIDPRRAIGGAVGMTGGGSGGPGIAGVQSKYAHTTAPAPMNASPAPGVPPQAAMGSRRSIQPVEMHDPRFGQDAGELGMSWEQRFRNIQQR